MNKKNYTIEQIQEAIEGSTSMMHAATRLNCNYKTFFTYAKLYGLFHPNPSGKGMTKNRPMIPLNEILNGDHPQYHTFKLKYRLIKEGLFEWKCNSCRLSEWLGAKIPLELDHINGVPNDHRLDNLRLLCPNCHALTPTYRAKNKK